MKDRARRAEELRVVNQFLDAIDANPGMVDSLPEAIREALRVAVDPDPADAFLRAYPKVVGVIFGDPDDPRPHDTHRAWVDTAGTWWVDMESFDSADAAFREAAKKAEVSR